MMKRTARSASCSTAGRPRGSAVASHGDPEASRRLENLLTVVVPEVLQAEAERYAAAD
jgi:hypothetical protein